MEQAKKEQTRIRVSFKVSAKGDFQPDITSEAETVNTAMYNLEEAYEKLMEFKSDKGYGGAR